MCHLAKAYKFLNGTENTRLKVDAVHHMSTKDC